MEQVIISIWLILGFSLFLGSNQFAKNEDTPTTALRFLICILFSPFLILGTLMRGIKK